MYLDGVLYHVYNRGAYKHPIFYSAENFRYCLRLLAKYSDQYLTSILCYCLMPNHYHLMIRQNQGGSAARFIQTVFNSYVQAINVQERRSGTLFESKAKRKIVDQYPELLACYFHLNPVQAGIVRNPVDWEFSDYRQWVGLAPPSVSKLDLRDELFDQPKDYIKYVRSFRNL